MTSTLKNTIAEMKAEITLATDDDIDSLTTLGYIVLWVFARKELRERLNREIGE